MSQAPLHQMSCPFALLILFALGGQVPASQSAPITVTGHPWAPFISPMGEPFRAHSTADDTLAAWFQRADRDHDGLLTRDEMVADAERFFAILDTNHDGLIDPDEIDHYEWEIAPEIQVNSRTRRPPGEAIPLTQPGEEDSDSRAKRRAREHEEDSTLGLKGALQGGARYGLLNIPEPVASADANFDRAISLDEFREAAIERFELLDSSHFGALTLPQLESLRQQVQGIAKVNTHGRQEHDSRLGNPVPGQP